MPKKHLQRRFESFTESDWASLLATGTDWVSRVAQASSRRSRCCDLENLKASAARGELSAVRHSLEEQQWHQGPA